ncbi:MAG TPA: GNAT family N-acetyltransferase [Trebonia sp.]|nr:GNAT family N-acetyltransferase [Trebonia sp.]
MATLAELNDEQAYEAELSQCVGVTGYHHWFFLSALAEALNLEFRAFAVDSDGTRLGTVPMIFRRSGPVSMVNFLPVGCIGPVIRGEALRAGRMGELLVGVEPVLVRHRAVAARWAFSPGLRLNPEELAIPKFEAFEWENFVMPATKSVDDVWKSMSTGRRQSVRQTEKRGVVVADSSVEEITGWFPGQMAELYEREGRIPAYSLPVVRTLAERMAGHPRMLWRTAKGEDGTIYGMTASIIGEDRLWGWQIAGPSVRSMSPHTLLHWDSIKWSRERELAYDMGGVPSEGVRVIKHSLAGEPETAVGLFRFRPSAAYRAATALRNWGPVRDNWVRMRRIIGD